MQVLVFEKFSGSTQMWARSGQFDSYIHDGIHTLQMIAPMKHIITVIGTNVNILAKR